MIEGLFPNNTPIGNTNNVNSKIFAEYAGTQINTVDQKYTNLLHPEHKEEKTNMPMIS